MKIVSTVLLLFALWLLGTLMVPSVRADDYDKKTVITFTQPFEIPGGKVLPAGTYTFKLLDSSVDRHIVQIFNADGTQIFATVLAINNYRFPATGKTVMLFSERPGDSPDALKAWFYPHDNFGQEFVYPKRRAIQLALAEKEPVPALTTDTLPVVAELKTAPIIAITPEQEEVPVAKVIQTSPLVAENELPQTASLVPLLMLLGVASVGFAFVLKRIAG
jgi:hypothetical protein